MSEQVRRRFRRFAAEVIFTNADDVPDVRAILADADCELEIDHDCIDEYTNYQWGMITGTTELAEDDIGGWLTALVPGNRIDLVQWRYGESWRQSEL